MTQIVEGLIEVAFAFEGDRAIETNAVVGRFQGDGFVEVGDAKLERPERVHERKRVGSAVVLM